MSALTDFKAKLNTQLQTMALTGLFVVDIETDDMWNTYLDSFGPNDNKIYKERREYDCQCCKQFIRKAGKIVTIVNNQTVTLWDIAPPDVYTPVTEAMSALIKSKKICHPFFHYEGVIGTPSNMDISTGIKWEHMAVTTPAGYKVYKDSIATKQGDCVTNRAVFKRGLEEITQGSLETILELIEQGSLYRGDQYKTPVQSFLRAVRAYAEVPEDQRENWLWANARKKADSMDITRFRNGVIGTLATDLSEGRELDSAVTSFEQKVAPANYKRPKKLVTAKMIAMAEAKVTELGLIDSLPRRFAKSGDIALNNVIYADNKAKREVFGEENPFAALQSEAEARAKPTLSKVEEVSIETFLKDVLPNSTALKMMVENKHSGRFVSLIAPQIEGAKPLFKWKNPFSWSYTGEVTDSIRERVKKAGGSVDGFMRASLSWYNYDDLDIHCHEPGGRIIDYSSKFSARTGGRLDIDMNAGGHRSREPVENITWAKKENIVPGDYKIYVHNYNKRETVDVGFEVEFEFAGELFHVRYDKPVSGGQKILAGVMKVSKDKTVKFETSLEQSLSSKEVWGVDTETWNRVTMVMNSPNFWDGEQTGNKHWFFMLDGCKNPDQSRGFYNEFLRDELHKDRKVFEVLGSKMKTPVSDDQLSGLGFSSTQRAEALFEVDGAFKRVVKVLF